MIHPARIAVAVLVGMLATVPAMAASEEEEPAPAEAAYFKLHPDFLVNISGGARPHFLLATVQVMSRDPETMAAIQQHAPALRHEMLMLLGDQDYASVEDLEARKKLGAEALAALNGVMERETGNAGVEGLYFTNFVVE